MVPFALSVSFVPLYFCGQASGITTWTLSSHIVLPEFVSSIVFHALFRAGKEAMWQGSIKELHELLGSVGGRASMPKHVPHVKRRLADLVSLSHYPMRVTHGFQV